MNFTITVYLNDRRLASYTYSKGDVTELLERISTFYNAVYPTSHMTYAIGSAVE